MLTACGRTLPLRELIRSDAGLDAGRRDAGFDAGVDAGVFDAGFDAGLPPEEDAGIVPCVPGIVTLKHAEPTVLLVLDRSGSMGTPFGRLTRWLALQQSLNAALPPVDETMALGAYIFPSNAPGLECAAPPDVDLLPSVGNANRIRQLLASSGPVGGTPTASAMLNAADALLAVRASRSARALILATDGAPGCNFALDPYTCVCTRAGGCGLRGAGDCLDDTRTVAALGDIANAGLPTWVIGLHDGADMIFEQVLNRMAVAGGRPRMTGGSQYYPAANQAELSSALVQIRDQIGACTFLTTSVPDSLGNIEVTVNGVQIDEDALDGWVWVDKANGELELVGPACTNLLPAAPVSAMVGCFDEP